MLGEHILSIIKKMYQNQEVTRIYWLGSIQIMITKIIRNKLNVGVEWRKGTLALLEMQICASTINSIEFPKRMKVEIPCDQNNPLWPCIPKLKYQVSKTKNTNQIYMNLGCSIKALFIGS